MKRGHVRHGDVACCKTLIGTNVGHGAGSQNRAVSLWGWGIWRGESKAVAVAFVAQWGSVDGSGAVEGEGWIGGREGRGGGGIK